MRSRRWVGAGAATMLGIVAVLMFVIGAGERTPKADPTAGALLAASETPVYKHATRAQRASTSVRYAGSTKTASVAAARQGLPAAVKTRRWASLAASKRTKVRRYTSLHDAVVTVDGKRAMVHSTLPLLAHPGGDKDAKLAPLDTDLRPVDGALLKPANVLSDYAIASGGGQLPDNAAVFFEKAGFGIAVPGAPADAEVTRLGDKALVSNVGTDTDLLITSLPAGVDVQLLLRSDASPRKHVLDLSAGGVSAKKVTDRGVDAVELTRDGRRVGTVQPPVATDADGRPVRLTWTVADDEMRIDVPHERGQYAMPIVVDPYVADDQRYWYNNASLDFTGWDFTGNPQYTGVKGSGFYGNGLNLYATTNQTYALVQPGNKLPSAGYAFRARNDGDLTHKAEWSKIFKADFGATATLPAGGISSCMNQGIYDVVNGRMERGTSPNLAQWRFGPTVGGAYTAYNTADPQYGFLFCGAEGTLGNINTYPYRVHCFGTCGDDGGSTSGAETRPQPGNAALLQILSGPGKPTSNGVVYMGSSLIFQSEQSPPRPASISTLPTTWIDDLSLSFNATDYGLGVASMALIGPGSTPTFTRTPPAAGVTSDCRTSQTLNPPSGVTPPNGTANRGDRRFPCPQTWPTWSVNTGGSTPLPEGSYTSTLRATDIVGNVGNLAVPLKIDRTAPTATSTGTLKDAKDQTTIGPYALNVSSADSGAGVKSIQVLVDDVQRAPEHLQEQTCVDGGCSLTRDFSIGNLPAGNHTIKVIVTDHVPAAGTSDVARHRFEETWNITVAAPPANVSPPVISGQPQDGETLQTTNGTWTGTQPLSYSYRWQWCDSGGTGCVDLAGETEPNVLLRWQDVGRRLRVVVRATNIAGSAEVASSVAGPVIAVAPQNSRLPLVRGVPALGELLSATSGIWDGTTATYTYQWLRCSLLTLGSCAPIAGANLPTYTLVAADLLATIRVRVTATNSVGTNTATSEPPTGPELLDLADNTALNPVGPTPPEELDEAQRFRQSFGLDQSPTLIAQLDADPTLQQSRDEYGVSLSRLEHRDLDARDRWQATVKDVVDYGEQYPGSYAGTWIDQENGGTIKVGFVSDVAARLSGARAAHGSARKIESFPATRTLAALEATQEAVDVATNSLLSEGIAVTELYIDVATNAVVVGVPSLTQPIISRLNALFGNTVRAVATGGFQTRTAGTSQADRKGRTLFQDAIGGLAIYIPGRIDGRDNCTLGLVGTTLSQGSLQRVDSFITAGHCSNTVQSCNSQNVPGLPGGSVICQAQPEERWRQGERKLGQTDGISYNTYRQDFPSASRKWKSDVIPIRLDRKGEPYIYYRADRNVLIDRTAISDGNTAKPSSIPSGTKVCISLGQGSYDVKCGKVRASNAYEAKDDRPSNGRTVYNSYTTDFKCKPGDSGSPVYIYRGKNRATAVGMQFGGTPVSNPMGGPERDGRCVWTHLKYIRDETTFAPISG